MKKVLLMAMVLVVAVMMSGCGLMGKNTPEGVYVHANPDGSPNLVVEITITKINDYYYKVQYKLANGTVKNPEQYEYYKEQKRLGYDPYFLFNDNLTEMYWLGNKEITFRKK